MINWLFNKLMPVPKEPLVNGKTPEELEQEHLNRIEQQILAEEEVQNMRFIIALSKELFPGDNSAIDRVEKAVEAAVKEIEE